MTKNPIWYTDASKINELMVTLNNIANDDKKNIKDYTTVEVVNEAKYILSLFYENEHDLNEILIGNFSREEQKQAKKDVRLLKKFIEKYTNIEIN